MISSLRNAIRALSVFCTLVVISAQENADKKVVCYYTDWSSYRSVESRFLPKDIQPNLCTHVIYSFLTFKDNMEGLESFDPYQDIDRKGFEQFAELKTLNKDLKLLGALGGWREGSRRFSAIAASKDKCKAFANGALEFLRQYKFDGINIDWQFPAFRDGGMEEDKDNFVILLKTMREVFDSEPNTEPGNKLLLTMSAPSETEYIDKGFDLPNLQKHVEFITIVAYDYHFSTDLVVNHHSPIYPLPEEEDEEHFNHELNIDWTIKYIMKKGVPNEKIILGIPAYGRTYTLEDENMHALGSPSEGEGVEGLSTREVGYKAYYEICQDIIKNSWTVVHVNRTAMGPYAYKGKNWVSFDDEDSAKRKGEYARDHNLGGIMFWAIDDDDFAGKCGGGMNSLITSAKEGFYSSPPTKEPPKLVNAASPLSPDADLSDTIIVGTTAPKVSTRKVIMKKKVATPPPAEEEEEEEEEPKPPSRKPAITTTREVKEGTQMAQEAEHTT